MNPTVQQVHDMDAEQFAHLVDEDVRGKAPMDLSEALRAEELSERWYQQLIRMKKSVESTIAAKTTEDKEQRLTLLAAASEMRKQPEMEKDLRRRADEAYRNFLKWRTGALRFRAGVEDRLTEASWKRRATGSFIPSALLDERDQLLRRVSDLTEAIQNHKASMADVDPQDIGESDEELWRILDGTVSRRRRGKTD